jgi:hypothetical protein
MLINSYFKLTFVPYSFNFTKTSILCLTEILKMIPEKM